MDKALLEAARKWVGQFNAIPTAIIEKAVDVFSGELEILSTIKECTSCGRTNLTYTEEDGYTCDDCGSIGADCDRYCLPSWGTMWTFGDSLDTDWARTPEGLKAMVDCGFWVYNDEDLGILFGLDGGGYDFYEEHWIPLYLARGLEWHKQVDKVRVYTDKGLLTAKAGQDSEYPSIVVTLNDNLSALIEYNKVSDKLMVHAYREGKDEPISVNLVTGEVVQPN